MEWKSWFRNSLVLLVLMVALFTLLTVGTGANIGPVELLIWLAILFVGLVLVGLGSKRSSDRKKITP